MSPETQRLINTVGYIGTLPRAPGTWGSLAAMLVGWGSTAGSARRSWWWRRSW